MHLTRNFDWKCIYPDWEGGLLYSAHKFDKDGYCIFCGYKLPNLIENDKANESQMEKNR